MSHLRVFRRFWYAQGKSPRKLALRRRLLVECLEQRTLLSVVTTPAAATTQHLTLADLPAAAQQAITTAISQQGKLTTSDATADDNFGPAIAVSGNTVVAGGAGGVCVFTGSGPGLANLTQVAVLKPSDGAVGNGFGESLAINGNTVVVGAGLATVNGNDDQGTVYVYTEPASGWASMTETAKLAPSDGTANDYFGGEVSISGNTVVVGAIGAPLGAQSDVGAAYLFAKPSSGWANMTQTAELSASDGTPGDIFGCSVSISANTVVVGAESGPSNGAGAAYVFSEPPSGWANMTQTAKLTASDGLAGDNFGASVSISGNTIAVAAMGIGIGGKTSSPNAVYVFTEPASGWTNTTQIAELSAPNGMMNMGTSLCINGSTVVAGSRYATVGGNTDEGAAFVFTEPSSGWRNMSPTAEFTAADGTANGGFGSSVLASGDTVLVGAMAPPTGSNPARGAVYVFTEPSSGWTNMSQATKLTASDGAYVNDLGDSVAISGNTVVVGAPDATVDGVYQQGTAYVFTESGSGWANMTQIAKLTASDGTANDDFGGAVAIDGNTIVVGAPDALNGSNSQYQGAAYVFTEPSTGWANMNQTAKLTAANDAVSSSVPALGALPNALGFGGEFSFGNSVAISGNTIVVGSRFNPTACLMNPSPGAAYVFVEPGTGWRNMTQTAKLTSTDGGYLFGTSVAISGNTVVVGEVTYFGDCYFFTPGVNDSPAAAYVFAEPSSGWANMTQTAKLTASDGGAYYNFGASVSIDGNTIVVGAPFSEVAATTPGAPSVVDGPGAAYVFTEPASGWSNMTQTSKLASSDDAASDNFGESVAISGNTIVVGSPGGDFGSSSPGAAYVFTMPAAGWANMTETAKVTASDAAGVDEFGGSVAISGGTLVVGAPGAAVGANVDQGAAYVFGAATATPPTVTRVSSTPPTIASPAVKSATIGQKYSYQVKTNAGSGQEITFLLGAAPAGMSINASTGLVTWVPNVFQKGSNTVTVLARDQFGDTMQQTFSISVSGVSTPYNPFAPTNRRLVIVGPVRAELDVGTTSGVQPASLKSNVVDQLLASSGLDLWL